MPRDAHQRQHRLDPHRRPRRRKSPNPWPGPGPHSSAKQSSAQTQTTEVTARDANTGQPLWKWQAPSPVQLLAGGKDRVFVLLTDRTLAGLDPRTGADLTRSGINYPPEPENPYAVSNVYTSNRYIVLERVNPNVSAEANDDAYYFTNRPVLIAIG